MAKKKPKKVKCPICNGAGNLDEAMGFTVDCDYCGGTGWVEQM